MTTESNHNSERDNNNLPPKNYFRQLFIQDLNRTTAFQNSDGSYTTSKNTLFTEQDLTDHLSGYKTIGLPVAENDLCKFAVINLLLPLNIATFLYEINGLFLLDTIVALLEYLCTRKRSEWMNRVPFLSTATFSAYSLTIAILIVLFPVAAIAQYLFLMK